MEQYEIPDLRQQFTEWADDLELLRQSGLLNEGAFIDFAKDRGLPVGGVVSGDPGDLHKRGLLTSDGMGYRDDPLFHPFRIYPLHKILSACDLKIAPAITLQREKVLGLVERVLPFLPSVEQIEESARRWNRIADLAILLEPLYWPLITHHRRLHTGVSESDHRAFLNEYHQKAIHFVRALDQEFWRKIHEQLRIDAAWLDKNSDLYLLLRLANWNRREKLKGPISGALWIRHVAEVIRRGFEEVYDEKWLEEDQAFGTWFLGARQRVFGSDRPLDDELLSGPYLAWEYGLLTGSVVRWYVEGDTEYHAILHILIEPAKAGIELVNLRGNIESDRDNAALKLRDWLMEDKKSRRFSMVSFDLDVAANVKAIRRQVDEQNVVGFIAAHKPDFEFANFTIKELVEIAAQFDEAKGISGDAVRHGDWTGVNTARSFETRYMAISARKPRALKGEEWGKALAAFAHEYLNRSDDGRERPFLVEIRTALKARIANYDSHKKHIGFDPKTFEQIEHT